MRDIDIFFAASKQAIKEGRPGDILKYALADRTLLFGILIILGIIAFFIRVYIWPSVNPFQFVWFYDMLDWFTAPRPPTPDETYPYAKVLYRTYR